MREPKTLLLSFGVKIHLLDQIQNLTKEPLRAGEKEACIVIFFCFSFNIVYLIIYLLVRMPHGGVGGLLSYKIWGSWYPTGLLSLGIGYAQKDFPSVNVKRFRIRRLDLQQYKNLQAIGNHWQRFIDRRIRIYKVLL